MTGADFPPLLFLALFDIPLSREEFHPQTHNSRNSHNTGSGISGLSDTHTVFS